MTALANALAARPSLIIILVFACIVAGGAFDGLPSTIPGNSP